MAPVLFLFLMSVFVETLEAEWKHAGIEVCTVQSFIGQSLTSGKGKLRGHLPKEYFLQELSEVEILQCLYVDDGAFIFKSRADMTRGLALLYCHFGRLGLEMYIGRGETPLKTECVFFPPPGFFDSHLPSLPALSDDETNNAINCSNDAALTDDEHCAKTKERSRREQEEDLYNNLERTQTIAVEYGFVTFCHHFKYLGSFVSFSLCDDYDIKKRVTATTQSMVALKNVWDSPHLDIWSKYLLFRAIPMNLLLWGCETWLMRKALSNKLEVFLHRSIWKILCISMFRVKEEQIHNAHVRRMIYDIPCVGNMIAALQLDFLGKTVRGPHDRPA
jgi:hypothetical protein